MKDISRLYLVTVEPAHKQARHYVAVLAASAEEASAHARELTREPVAAVTVLQAESAVVVSAPYAAEQPKAYTA